MRSFPNSPNLRITAKPGFSSHSTRAGSLLQRKCACGAATSSLTGECQECRSKQALQAKLTIGTSNDPLEKEADRVAGLVLAEPSNPEVTGAAPYVQRLTGQPTAGADTAPASVGRALAGSGAPLAPALQQDMGQRFGHDFSRVRVHSGAAAEQSAQDVNASAYTVGHDIVFGAGHFVPGTREGRRLIAHELTHVMQQSEAPQVMQKQEITTPSRAPDSDEARAEAQKKQAVDASKHRRNLESIAERVYDAMEGLGTDEEAVYRALQELDRDPKQIEDLMTVYSERHGSLLVDLQGDFSGTELEFALQLLNIGHANTPQSVQDKALPEPKVAALRIRDAVEGPGTDEEEIYAVLVPFHRDTLKVQVAYQEMFGEDLRDRIGEEMSGFELEYALELLETPYEHYVQEGNERLAGAPFPQVFDVSAFCFPQEDSSSSSGRKKLIYWYDKDNWDLGDDPIHKGCTVKLLTGRSPAWAIDEMFDHQDRWQIACAEFVQIVHLYALRHTLGAKRFDERVGRGGFTLEVKRRESTGIETVVVFEREKPWEPMVRSGTGELELRTVDEILDAAPIGSRVRWTNLAGQGAKERNAWQNENTIKLGPNKFAAHGTETGVFSKSNTHTREEIELFVARNSDPNANAIYVRDNIFISEIEIFQDPSRPATKGAMP